MEQRESNLCSLLFDIYRVFTPSTIHLLFHVGLAVVLLRISIAAGQSQMNMNKVSSDGTYYQQHMAEKPIYCYKTKEREKKKKVWKQKSFFSPEFLFSLAGRAGRGRS